MQTFMTIANTINECLHAYGIHSATLQPEFSPEQVFVGDSNMTSVEGYLGGIELRERSKSGTLCLVGCQSSQCEQLSCCD
jgi:zinc transporter 1